MMSKKETTTTTTTVRMDTKNNKSTSISSSSSSSRIHHSLVIGLSMFIGMIFVRNRSYSNDPLIFLIPNFLMFTPYKIATQRWWKYVLRYDTTVIKEPQPISELTVDEYSFDGIRKCTENFRVPCVVRGLFLNTTAVRKWTEPGYMSDKIGHYKIRAYENSFHDHGEFDHLNTTFHNVYEEILSNKDSLKYLFFPEQFNTDINKVVDELVIQDLDVERIFHGFGNKQIHKQFKGTQFIAGHGRPANERPTGSFWHCAIVNNWFVQVAGRKHWLFLDQKYSSYMSPQRHRIGNMAAGSDDIIRVQKYLPLKYVDLNPGDLLYNPEWEWHKIINYEGLTIGVPIREMVIRRSLNNNMQYFTISIINFILDELFGISYGLVD